MFSRRFLSMAALIALLTLSGLAAPASQATPAPQAARQGAWVDSVVFTAQGSASAAVKALQAGELDLYAYAVSSSSLFQQVIEDPDLAYTQSYGLYNEITFNPYGPTFVDGRLNPFSNARIRAAMNRLVDRAYIAHVIYGGLATPRGVPVHSTSADHARYLPAIQALEAEYAHDLARAGADIAAEMLAMGAYLEGGTWHYAGQEVVLIFLIRVEDVRRQIGDYVARQLEAIGFSVDRQYKTAAEASPIWFYGDPADGLWHLYTGGWITTAVSRDGGGNFSFFYTPHGIQVPLWQAYRPTPAFDEVALRLAEHDFATMAERDQLFEQALALSFNDAGAAPPEGAGSLRVWLADLASFTPRRAELAVVSDRAGGVAGTPMWPYVVRFEGVEGGTLRIALPGLLGGLWKGWNAFSRSDLTPIWATQDDAFLPDPWTGLRWPQRAERAEVVVQDGLPVAKTLDWVDLTFAPQIDVPADAWVDWDAAQQRFVTRAEKYPGGLTAKVKSTVHYPAGMFSSVTWHDGSPLDLSDLVLKMILTFDRGKPESAIYDQWAAEDLDAFLAHFRGLRIVSADPLVIETYDDTWQLDAEWNVQSWWPEYGGGMGAWHNLAAAIRAEAAGELALSWRKANARGIEMTSFIAGPSLPILSGYVDQSAGEDYIPYLPTLGAYVTQAEADARWAALQAWYAARGHFWLGTGPFYLESVFPDEPRLVLRHNPAFPDPAGKWDAFAAEPNPQMQINYPSGAPGSFFNVTGSGFPPGGTAWILANGRLLALLPVDGDGEIAFTLTTAEATRGTYHLRVSVNPAAGLKFVLDPSEPVREREGELPPVEVPAGLVHYCYLPLVARNR